MSDSSFIIDREGLLQAIDALLRPGAESAMPSFPATLPETGMHESQVVELLAPFAIGRAQRLGAETAFAHMDPPTPWLTWAMALWNAALNQNLLHPDVAPVAREIEAQVLQWLAPIFGMSGGHMTPGSTISNLTALWAARELRGVKRVVASSAAHISIAKAAHILGLGFTAIESDRDGRLTPGSLPDDLADAALVLTAGTTSAGVIDVLVTDSNAAWTHVDAAWAGPLRLSAKYADKLAGIESADSIAVSAHKWLFQPKDSGLVLFRDVTAAHSAVSFGAEYLAVPNVGVLGSRGANALPLLATLLAWGRTGVGARIERAMAAADTLYDFLSRQDAVRLYGPNISGVILWRPEGCNDVAAFAAALPQGAASVTTLDGQTWVRHVAANPNVAVEQLQISISGVLAGQGFQG